MQSANSSAMLFWAVARGLLGVVQMAGAITSLLLLLRFGRANETFVALGVTMTVTVFSILLFKILRVQDRV